MNCLPLDQSARAGVVSLISNMFAKSVPVGSLASL